MKIADALIQELDLETPFTRVMLERAPADRFGWKPHEKSMTLGWLATFSAYIWEWGADVVEKDVYDFATEMAGRPKPGPAASTAELLELFDTKVAAARRAIESASDDELMTSWTLLVGGRLIFSRPKWLTLRTYVFNHAVHHRGQLSVFLRLLDVPVPAIYNDSADERGGMFIEAPVPR
jgi:hypothetical protein